MLSYLSSVTIWMVFTYACDFCTSLYHENSFSLHHIWYLSYLTFLLQVKCIFIPNIAKIYCTLLFWRVAIINLCPIGSLKVLTNEKRGGLTVVSLDRSRFKLILRKFSNKSVQAPSCERHKTTQRTPVSIICKQLLIPNNAIVSGCDTLFTSYT